MGTANTRRRHRAPPRVVLRPVTHRLKERDAFEKPDTLTADADS
jgi:hypothetical protein